MNRYNQPAFWTIKAIFVLVSLAMIFCTGQASAQSIRSQDEVARAVTIDKIAVKDETISGEVHNLSPNSMRDVQLYTRYIWMWDNEFHPGSNDPSASFIYTVPQEIPPGGSVPFTFSPSPTIAKPSGGRFMVRVSAAGYTEVIPAKR
jgi:hypothetical protein